MKDITQISKADVVVEGVITFIREYKGTASILLRTDNWKAVEHLATPMPSLKKWNLKVSQSCREVFEKHRHIVGIVYERRSVVTGGIRDFRALGKAKKGNPKAE